MSKLIFSIFVVLVLATGAFAQGKGHGGGAGGGRGSGGGPPSGVGGGPPSGVGVDRGLGNASSRSGGRSDDGLSNASTSCRISRPQSRHIQSLSTPVQKSRSGSG